MYLRIPAKLSENIEDLVFDLGQKVVLKAQSN